MAERFRAYLITHADHAPPADARGVGGAPLRSLVEGELAVWVSGVDGSADPADLRSIARHNQVIQQATTPLRTPVPLRFGQIAGEETLRSALATRAAHWRQRLDEFAGAAEFGLLVSAAAPSRAQNLHREGARSGRHFLEKLAARERRAAEITAAVHAAVAGLVRRERVESVSDAGVVARVAHLVGTPDADAYRAAIDRLAEAHPDCGFHTSGPWPPYSFAA